MQDRISAQEKINRILNEITKGDKSYNWIIAGDVPARTYSYVQQYFNIDIHNYKYIVEKNYIIHAITKHSNDEIPINYEDFLLIPHIISSFDKVTVGKIKENGNKTLKFYKQIGDNTYCVSVQEIRNRRKSLAFNTMYKIKRPPKI